MPSSNDLHDRFTTGELRIASFWVHNRIRARQIGYGFLILIASILWAYVLWTLADTYLISYPRESRIIRDIALNQQRLASLESDRPQDVSFSDVSVYQTTENRLDFAVEMTNPNPMWWAEFNYKFNVSGEETALRTGYILPQGTHILTELGYTPKTLGASNATLVIENVRWHRIDPKVVGLRYDDFARTRFAFEAKDINYTTDLVIGARPVGQSTFTLVNGSAYGYWSVDLVVRLFRGPSVVAVQKIAVTNIQPGEKRPIALVWLENLPSITKTEVIPQINLLDPRIYLPTKYWILQ